MARTRRRDRLRCHRRVVMLVYLIALAVAAALIATAVLVRPVDEASQPEAAAPDTEGSYTPWLAFGVAPIVVIHLLVIGRAYVGWGDSDSFTKGPFFTDNMIVRATLPEVILLIGGFLALRRGKRDQGEFYLPWCLTVGAALAALAWAALIP